MTTPGLALIGFMDLPLAISYLRARCITTQTDKAIEEMWNDAKSKLGPPVENSGKPEIKKIPAEHNEYLNGIQKNPRFQETINGFTDWSFGLVEVDKLLAFQFHVELTRSENLCSKVDYTNVCELLKICLPHDLEAIPFTIHNQPNSILFKAKSSNFRLMTAGLLGADNLTRQIAGIAFGASSPLVQVATFAGKAYLRNGFHRCYGLRKSGAKYVPSLILKATDYSQIGARGEGATFDRALLESENPPTCGHFTDGRACQVELKNITKLIQVTWSDYSILDGD